MDERLFASLCGLLDCGSADLNRLIKVCNVLALLGYDVEELVDEFISVTGKPEFNELIAYLMLFVLDELGYPDDNMHVNWADSWYGYDILDDVLWKDYLFPEEVLALKRRVNNNGN